MKIIKLTFLGLLFQGCQKDFQIKPTYNIGTFYYTKKGETTFNAIPITYYGNYKMINGKYDFGSRLSECNCCLEAVQEIQKTNIKINTLPNVYSFKIVEGAVKNCK